MPSPSVVFRVPHHVMEGLTALSERVGVSPGLIARTIVVRDLTQTAAMLTEHDEYLEHMFLMIKDIAHVHRDLMREGTVSNDDSARAILVRLAEIARAVDSIRDAAFVRPSTTVQDLIAAHDKRSLRRSVSN